MGALSSRQAPAPVEALYRRYRRDVLALAYTNVGNRADAEDLAQTTFLNAHRAIVGGAQPTNERAWLLAIARNLCRKRFHGLTQRPREEPFNESHHPTEAEDAGAEHDVVAAINTLPPRQREAIVLQAVHGCTTAEIGNRLGLGGAAVDALLFRARSALRDTLEADAQPIACARTEALAAGQLAHELDCSEQAALRAHLRTCPQCASRVRSLRARKRIASLLTFPWELLSRIPGLAGANAGVGAKATIVLALTLGAAGVEGASPPPLPPSAASVAGPEDASPQLAMPTRAWAAPPRPRPLAAPIAAHHSGTNPATVVRHPPVASVAAPLPETTTHPPDAPPPARVEATPRVAPSTPSSTRPPAETKKVVAKDAPIVERAISDLPQLPIPDANLPNVKLPELPTVEVPELATVELPELLVTDAVSSTLDVVAEQAPALPRLPLSP